MTAVPTAPVAPVTIIALSLNLFKYFREGWYLSRNSSSSTIAYSGVTFGCTKAAYRPPKSPPSKEEAEFGYGVFSWTDPYLLSGYLIGLAP